MILVPATMKLRGRADWSLPGWLDRIVPEIEIEHAPAIKPPKSRCWPRQLAVDGAGRGG